MKFVFWWNSPCKGMIGVLREFCLLEPDTVVYTGPTGKKRLAMGWQEQESLFAQHKIISFDPQEHSALLKQHTQDFHIVNGLVRPYYRSLLQEIINQKLPYATMTEAPCNMFSGRKRLLKKLYYQFVQPARHRSFAATAKGFISLSGGKEKDIQKIHHLGFPRENIYAFGYYTDVSTDFAYQAADDEKIHLLCPGLLEKYKGVDLLIQALGKLKAQGLSGFVCHITGQGSQYAALENLIRQRGLQESVILHGALPESDYQKILKSVDILVAPGREEPWGIRVNEAIQRGQAVVVSDHMGASVLIEQSQGGAVFTAGSSADLAAKLFPLLVSREKLQLCKEKNVAYRERISCKNQAGNLHMILTEIIGKTFPDKA